MRPVSQALLLIALIAILSTGAILPIRLGRSNGTSAPPSSAVSYEVVNAQKSKPVFIWELAATPTIPPGNNAVPTATPVIHLAVHSMPVLYAFVRAPTSAVAEPFVILTAYRSIAIERPLQISGSVDGFQFACPNTPCRLPVSDASILSFQAEDPFGGKSSEVRVVTQVVKQDNGYIVSLEQLSQFFAHRDACAAQWGFTSRDTAVSWNTFPQRPDLLATNKTLHYLAGQLIRAGIVDAQQCPGGGIDLRGAPNLCGVERAHTKMVEWQNLFDFDIWLTSKDLQMPPTIIKSLIEAESQFWPANSRSYVDEVGLGQLNQLGVDILLRNDPSLYYQICPSVLGDCSVPYPALPDALQRLIRGALLNSVNAYCENCPYKIDINTARQSVTFVGLILRANCKLVDQVMDLYDAEASYEDHWKFTLMSYHSGLSCMENAVEKLTAAGEATDWKHVSNWNECPGASEYAERVWASVATFDSARLPMDDNAVSAAPQFIPTPTPVPTIGPPPSSALAWVIVILDENMNGVPESTEWVNGVPVRMILPDGTDRTALTINGKAEFDLHGLTTGAVVTFELPSLYRTSKITVPTSGITPVVFVFFPPPITPIPSQPGTNP